MSRALFTSTSGAGHLMPLLPIAGAAQERGWDVALAAPPEVESMVTSARIPFRPLPGIPGDDPRRGEIFGRVFDLPEDERNSYVVREIFGRLNTAGTLPHMQTLFAEFRPDVVVSEAAECAGGLVAEAMGLPVVRVHPGLTSLEFMDSALADGVAELRAQLGLPADQGFARLRAVPQVAYFPAAMEYPGAGPTEVLRIRDPRYVPEGGDVPRGGVVFVTFGSEAAQMPFFGEVVQASIDAVVAAGRQGVVALGRHGEPSTFTVPPGVVVERWVDQGEVLRRTSAIVCHGGAGTVLSALSLGVPMVVVPLFADQRFNAERAAANDVAEVVPPGPGLVERLSAALAGVLASPPAGAALMRDAIAAQPETEAAVSLLGEIA